MLASFGTLAQLRAEGVIRHIGLSNINAEQLRSAQSIVEIAAVTAHYNVAYRYAGPLLEAAEQAGVVFSPWHALTIVPQGADPIPFKSILEPIAKEVRRHGATSRSCLAAAPLARHTANPRHHKSDSFKGKPRGCGASTHARGSRSYHTARA